MTDGTSTSLLRRRIGRRLAQLRAQAGFSQEQARKQLGLSRTTVGRIEDGDERASLKELYIKAMLDLYGATPEESAALLAAVAETRSVKGRPWWHSHGETELPSWFVQYLTMEAAAERIRQYEPELIPGLLQTRTYAELVMGTLTGYLSAEDIERRVAIRMERQSLLTRPRPPHLDVVINEAILQRPVDTDSVMVEQLRHLLDITQRASVSIRVLPWSAGAHAGMAACGPFTFMSFPADPSTGVPSEEPLVYTDALTGAMYHNKPEDVAAYRAVWEDVAGRALDEPASRNLITATLKEMER